MSEQELDRRAKILEMANGDSGIFEVIHDAVVDYNITAKSYAMVFCRLFYDGFPESKRLSYSAKDKTWKMGKSPISDIRFIAMLSQVCDIIREYIYLNWEECVFSAWLSPRELQKVVKSMDAMETMEQIKEIWAMAASVMQSYEGQDKAIDWTDMASEDEEPQE